MDATSDRIKNNRRLLVASLLALLTFITLYTARSLDDNRLTSWAWVFQAVDAAKIYSLLVIGIVLSLVLSRLHFPRIHPATALFVLSFGAAALFWSESEVIVDASRYFTQAKHLEVHGAGYFIREWGKGFQAWTDLPAVPFLYGMIFKLLGEHRIYIQIFTSLLFSLTVVLTHQIGKTLWDEATGFTAGLLLLGIPYLFTQVPLMLVDVPTMFFLALSVFFFIKAMQKVGVWMVLSPLAVFFAFFSKYSTWIMLSVLVVIALVSRTLINEADPTPRHRRRPPPAFSRGLIIALISCVLIGTVVWYKFDVFSEQIRLLTAYQKPGLRRWGEGFLSTFFFQIHPFITFAALYSLYTAFKKRDPKYVIISFLVLLMVFMRVKRIRYLVAVFPMLALMASYGLQSVRSCELRKFIISLCLLASLIIATFGYLPFLQKFSTVNLKDAGRYLDSLDIDAAEVHVLPQADPALNPAVSVPILDYFTRRRIFYEYIHIPLPPGREIETSPLRFTWEYKNPAYYAGTNATSKGKTAVVVISNGQNEVLTESLRRKVKHYRNSTIFETSEGLFRYRPVVRVFYDGAQNTL